MRFSLFALAFLLFSIPRISAQKAPTRVITYRNPVIAGDFADPSVIRVGDTYYAAGTSSEWGPAYPVYSSKNLINWDYVGPVFKELPGWTMGSYWAPELFFRNGTFYCYYTARRKSDQKSFIGVASTKDIRKGFKDHGLLLEWTSEAIDAFVVEDKGQLYLTWKAYGLDKGREIEILGAELSQDGLKVTGKEFSLIKADPAGWESGGAEGQAIFKRGNYWYMLYSGNACCGDKCDYQVGFARAENLKGPWVKYAGNPSLFGDQTWKCPGHGTVVVTADNRYFYLHHAYNAVDFTFTGRQGVLSELIFDEASQWPAFRYGKTTPAQAEAPSSATAILDPSFSLDYELDTMQAPWVYDVHFAKPEYALEGGALRVSNTGKGPVGNFLGLVLKKGNYTFSAQVRMSELMQNLVLYGDAENAIGLGVRQEMLEVWQLREGKRQVIKSQSIPDSFKDIVLKVNSRYGRLYDFSWEVKGQKIDSLASTVHLEAPWLPRWDRAPRIGLSVSGTGVGKSEIKAVSMKYD
jgi:beta-xylosidase